jgi:hypothetical protein
MFAFARISSTIADSALGDLVPNGDLAHAWLALQQSQSVVARRQRLGLRSNSSSNTNNSNAEIPHANSSRCAVVCNATRGKNSKSSSSASSSSRRRPSRRSSLFAAVTRPARALQLQAGVSSRSSPLAGHHALQQQRQQQQHPFQQLPSQQQQQQQQPQPATGAQLTACIEAAQSFAQLEAVCNTFLGHAAFTPRHAALVLSRLHLVRCRPTDSPLLLVELLAQQLRAGTTAHTTASTDAQQQQQQQQLSCGEAAAACWAFARAGYQPGGELLLLLLAQFWQRYDAAAVQLTPQQLQAQQCAPPDDASSSTKAKAQQQQQQWPPTHAHEALAALAAGLAGLGVRDSSTWARMKPAVQAALQQQQGPLPARCLQQLAWGFATVQQADAATTAALAGALTGRLSELDTADALVTTAWSMHLCGCQDARLYEAAALLLLQRVRGSSSGRSSSGAGARSPRASSPQRLLSTAAGGAAALCSAATSQALGALRTVDPLLCLMAVYKEHCQPTTS